MIVRGPSVACVNRSKLDLGAPFGVMIAALQKCYDQHFLPVWGYPLRLRVTGRPRRDEWQMIFMDTADDADALGYHDLTRNSQPVSKIFVRSTIDSGEKVSVTACHELFEMAIDPVANIWAENSDGVEFAYEMCDAVEEDTFDVDGVTMSNFVHPSWFEPFRHPPGTKFDHLGLLRAPFTMTSGGYVITKTNGKVEEKFASGAKRERFLAEDRRGHRSESRKVAA